MGAVNNEILTHLTNIFRNDFPDGNLTLDEYNEYKLKNFCKSMTDDVSRLERVRRYCNVELCKISVNYSQKVQIIAFDRTTPSIDKKMAKHELTKDPNCQGNFMNKFVNGTTRFQHAQKDNTHLIE